MPPKGKFRLDTKELFLTFPGLTQYASIDAINLAEVYQKFVGFFSTRGGIKTYVICKELHEDGTPHIHCCLQLWRKYETRNARCFDGILGFHGSYEGARSYKASVAYCRKDGQYISGGFDAEPDLELVPIGKRRKVWDDFKWHQQFTEAKSAKSIDWPVSLRATSGPSGAEIFETFTMDRPNVRNKCRNWWIVGEPNMGKTRWINQRFGGMKVFIPKCDTEFPFEDYNDEELIVFDDGVLKFQQMVNILNEHKIRTAVPGKIRYTNIYWKLGSVRNIIVLSNKSINDIYENNREAMHARFIEIYNPKFEFIDEEESIADILVNELPIPNLEIPIYSDLEITDSDEELPPNQEELINDSNWF